MKAASKKLDLIEVIRGVAAVAVVLYHVARHLDSVTGQRLFTRLFQFGHAGVDLFFVLSGFIILYIHAGDIGRPARLGHYVSRRLTRVLPTYWVALGLTLLLVFAGRGELPAWLPLVKSLLLLPQDTEPLLGVAWTLTYEMVFYAVFAVLIVHRRLGMALVAAWFAAILASFAGLRLLPMLPASLLGVYNIEFFFGMAMAAWLRARPVPRPDLVLALGVAVFLLVAVLENAGIVDGYAALARLAYGPASALIVAGAAGIGMARAVRVPSLLRTLGAASYSIYLFQFVFIGIAWKLWSAKLPVSGTPALLACFVLLSVAAVAGAVVVSRLVEYPLMRAVRRWSERRAARAAVGTSA